MIKKFIPALFLLSASLPGGAAPIPKAKNSPVAYQKLLINGVQAYVVTVDLNCKRISLVPHSSNGNYKSFGKFIKESKPLAAINGTFFDPATATVICNLVSQGKLLSEGRVGHSLCIDKNNQARLLTTAGLPGRQLDLRQWAFGLSSGPTLLRSHQYVLAPGKEGFRDPGLLGLAPRSAMGITVHNKLLLVSVRKPVRLQRLSWMMKSLGARDAINLDGGSSSALYFQGNYVTRPKRMLTNIVGVHLQPEGVPQKNLVQEAIDIQPVYDAANVLPVAIVSPQAEAPLDPEYVEDKLPPS